MSRTVLLIALTAPVLAAAIPLSEARADGMHDLSRKSYRLGVAALDAVDATPAQRRAISDAAKSLGHRLAPLEKEAVAWGRSAHKAWVADTVTRASVESVRVQGVELVDATSAETVDFVVEVARVLTPEQRADLARMARDAVLRWHTPAQPCAGPRVEAPCLGPARGRRMPTLPAR